MEGRSEGLGAVDGIFGDDFFGFGIMIARGVGDRSRKLETASNERFTG